MSLRGETARADHLQTVLVAAQAAVDVVRAERELDARRLRPANEVGLRQPQLVADLDGHVPRRRRVDNPLQPLGGPQRVVLLGDHLRQIRRIHVDVDRLVGQYVDDGPRQQFHEGLLVGHVDFILEPQPRPLPAMIDDRHAVGEDVVEAGQGLLREQLGPLAALGLHADEGRPARHPLHILLDAAVVGDGKLQPAVGGDAVEDTGLLAVGDRLLGRQPALEMDVQIHERKALAVEFRDLGVDGVGSGGDGFSGRLPRRHADAHVLQADLGMCGAGGNFQGLRQGRVGLGRRIVDHLRAVDRHDDPPAVDRNAQLEPRAVAGDRLVLRAETDEAAGLGQLGRIVGHLARVVDAHLRAEHDAARRARLGQHLGFQREIRVRRAALAGISQAALFGPDSSIRPSAARKESAPPDSNFQSSADTIAADSQITKKGAVQVSFRIGAVSKRSRVGRAQRAPPFFSRWGALRSTPHART